MLFMQLRVKLPRLRGPFPAPLAAHPPINLSCNGLSESLLFTAYLVPRLTDVDTD